MAAAFLALGAVGLVWVNEDMAAEASNDVDGLAWLLTLGMTVPVAWRRRAPRVVLATTFGAMVVYLAADWPETLATLGSLIAVYSVAAHVPRPEAKVALGITGVVLALLLVAGSLATEVTYEMLVSNFIVFGTAWILGDNMRTRRAYVAELEARAERLDLDRRRQARRAVADERARIARELHDVVAHSVSVMVVQAGAARRVLASDPGAAAGALGSIEATGREALAEMRRMLGVLRSADEPSEPGLDRAPQPDVGHLDRLVAAAREAGLDTELVVEGEPRPLPVGVDVSAYRIVQEALTNSLKHAGPARACVCVRYGERQLDIEVTDDGRGAAAPAAREPGGHGLVGMRERVNLFSGELHAGPRAGGGFGVRARLPLDGAPSREQASPSDVATA
jgi:signal transduction histidine kinase